MERETKKGAWGWALLRTCSLAMSCTMVRILLHLYMHKSTVGYSITIYQPVPDQINMSSSSDVLLFAQESL